jgi:hypothetical protein
MGQQMSGVDAPDFASDAVVFSLRDGYVWASWPEASGTVRLGSYDTVLHMMRDFVAQSELGERLTNGKAANGSIHLAP